MGLNSVLECFYKNFIMGNGSGLRYLWGNGDDNRDGDDDSGIKTTPRKEAVDAGLGVRRPNNAGDDTWKQRVEFAQRLRQSARPPAPQSPQSRRSVFSRDNVAPGLDPPPQRAAGLRSVPVTSPHRATLPPPPSSGKAPSTFPPKEPSSAQDCARRASEIMAAAREQNFGNNGPLSASGGRFGREPISTANVDDRLAAVKTIGDVRAVLAMDPNLLDLDAETQGALVTIIGQLIMEAKKGDYLNFMSVMNGIKSSADKLRDEGATFLMVELAKWLKGQLVFLEGGIYEIQYVSFRDLLDAGVSRINVKDNLGETERFSLMEIFSGLKMRG